MSESAQPTSTRVPKRLQSLIQVDNTQTKDIPSPVDNHHSGILNTFLSHFSLTSSLSLAGSDSDHSSIHPAPPSPLPEFTDSALPDKPVARRIKKIINRLDLPDENPSPSVSRPPPPPPKNIWQDGEDDELPPVIRRPRRRQLDDPIEETPVPVPVPPTPADPVVEKAPFTPPQVIQPTFSYHNTIKFGSLLTQT